MRYGTALFILRQFYALYFYLLFAPYPFKMKYKVAEYLIGTTAVVGYPVLFHAV